MPAPSWFRPALVHSLASGYTRQDFTQDLLAGLLVGVVALPLSMGLAIASGCRPEQGLYTAIIGGFVVALLGGSKVQVAGPAGAFVGLCAAGVTQFGYDGLALATLMAGVLIALMGLLRLGKAISFIPIPVVIGFTTGIAAIIASTQIGPAFGMPVPTTPLEHVHERIAHLAQHAREARLTPALLCVSTIVIISGLRRASARLPGAMIAVAAVAIAAWALHLDAATIGERFPDFTAATLPHPHLPSLVKDGDPTTLAAVMSRVAAVSGLALAIALLGSIESLLSAVVADGLSGDRHDSNTELVAQGAANLLSPLLMGLPVTGVIARTSTNIRAGARTPVSAIVHSLTVLVVIVAAAPLVAHVPLASLAGVLLVVCWHMAEFRHWPHILRAGRSDAALLPLAFLMTVFVGLQWAVPVGVLLAMLFFVRRMSEAVRIERNDDPGKESTSGGVHPGVEVYEVNGPFFFGAATLIRDLDVQLERQPRAMILRLRHVPFVDATAAFALRELVASCRKKGITFMLCELDREPAADCERHGVLELVGAEHVHADLDTALAAAGKPAAGMP